MPESEGKKLLSNCLNQVKLGKHQDRVPNSSQKSATFSLRIVNHFSDALETVCCYHIVLVMDVPCLLRMVIKKYPSIARHDILKG